MHVHDSEGRCRNISGELNLTCGFGKYMLTVSGYLPTCADGRAGRSHPAGHPRTAASGTAGGRRARARVSRQPAGDLAASANPEARPPRRRSAEGPAGLRVDPAGVEALRAISIGSGPTRWPPSRTRADQEDDDDCGSEDSDAGRESDQREDERRARVRRVHARLRHVVAAQHHIGKSPMKQAIIEETAGGRCYTSRSTAPTATWGQRARLGAAHASSSPGRSRRSGSTSPTSRNPAKSRSRFTPEAGRSDAR